MSVNTCSFPQENFLHAFLSDWCRVQVSIYTRVNLYFLVDSVPFSGWWWLVWFCGCFIIPVPKLAVVTASLKIRYLWCPRNTWFINAQQPYISGAEAWEEAFQLYGSAATFIVFQRGEALIRKQFACCSSCFDGKPLILWQYPTDGYPLFFVASSLFDRWISYTFRIISCYLHCTSFRQHDWLIS